MVGKAGDTAVGGLGEEEEERMASREV